MTNKKHWTDALPKATDKKPELKIVSVEKLNADGTTTDITDKPDEWFPELPPVANTTLNEKIRETLQGCRFNDDGNEEAANEIEKLVLQEKIGLLNEIRGYYLGNKIRDFEKKCDAIDYQLTEQLNQLTNKP